MKNKIKELQDKFKWLSERTNSQLKEETLEEAAEEHHLVFTRDLDYADTRKKCFIEGAKWQGERSYSEEEVKRAFKTGFSIGYSSDGYDKYEEDLMNRFCEEWFEQFKKK